MKKSLIVALLCMFLIACNSTQIIENNQNNTINESDSNSSNQNEIELLGIESQINDFNCAFIGYAHYDEAKNQIHSATCLSNQQQPDGGYVQYNTEGKIIVEGTNSNGNRNGEWRTYYDDGKIQSITFYKDGKLHGEQKLFDKKLLETINYKEGIQNGLNEFEDNSIEYKNGTVVYSDVNTKLISNSLIENGVNCYSDYYCFAQMLKQCKVSVFEFPANQVITIIEGNQENCLVYTNYTSLIDEEYDYYQCPINISMLPEKNRPSGFTPRSFDLWVDVFLEDECEGTFVDKVEENGEYFFERFTKTALSKDYKTQCIFSLNCGEDHYCYENICTPLGVLK